MIPYLYLSSNRFTAKVTDISGDPFDGADVQFTLKNAAGANVGAIAWPVTMDKVGGGSGEYTYVPPWDIPVENNKDYYAELVVTDVGGTHRFARVQVHVATDAD